MWRWFPSSKTCSGCGKVQPMPLNEHVYQSDRCGVSVERDLNAAIALENAASYPCTWGKRVVYACFHCWSRLPKVEAGSFRSKGAKCAL
ncbi:MAG TPA: hypothetical protein DCY88_32640 [Cyanobacteria bacterium UBA11372]|nr:hypothetical protein [Cyanobacteria bacterium UBA11372]